MKIVRLRSSYFIEYKTRFLFWTIRKLLTFSVKEWCHGEYYSEMYDRYYFYEFPSYLDAEKFLKHHGFK